MTYLAIHIYQNTSFTIQNVPIKCDSEKDKVVLDENLQYKMFLLNEDCFFG